ncbi:MAG: hypothetical protein WC641_05810 [Patescibacteria group bacterium]
MNEAKLSRTEHVAAKKAEIVKKIGEGEGKKSEIQVGLEKAKTAVEQARNEKAQVESNLKSTEALRDTMPEAVRQSFEAPLSALKQQFESLNSQLTETEKEIGALADQLAQTEKEMGELSAEQSALDAAALAESAKNESPAEAESEPGKNIAFQEALSADKEKMKQGREKIGNEFQAAIDANKQIPDAWKKNIHDSMTKELTEGVAEGASPGYYEDPKVIAYESENRNKKMQSLNYIPDAWKALDPEIAKLDEERGQAERDSVKIKQQLSFIKQSTPIEYSALPKSLGEQLGKEWNEAAAKGASSAELLKLKDEQGKKLSAAMHESVWKIDAAKSGLKDRSAALMKNPEYSSTVASMAVQFKKAMEAVQDLHA